MATRLGLLISVPMFAVLSCSPVAAAPDDYQGQPIASIQFEPEKQPLTREQLLARLAVKPGQVLRNADVRDSIQRLYATGEYADIAVDASRGAGGIVLKFITKPTFFVGGVRVNGVPEPPNQGQLVGATKLQPGTEYADPQLERAVNYLVDVLKRNGFYKATVTPATGFDAATQQVNIDFNVVPGERARFDGLIAQGRPERSTEQLVKSTGWKRFRGLLGWQSLTETRLQNGIDNVRNWYPKHDRLMARVRLAQLDFHSDTNRVTPELEIDAGPPVKVRLRGAKISGGKLRSLLPIYQERSVDRDLLMEGNRDLVSYFESQGYFDANVSYTLAQPPSGEQLIDYEAELGVRHKLVSVEFNGNHYFDRETLRERMTIVPATLIRYRWGRYSRASLERDLNSIRDLYRSNGFRDVEVASREIDDYQGKKGRLGIVIDIREGPQWFVSKLDIRGASAEDLRQLRARLHSTEGQPFSDFSLAEDRDEILDYYFNNGYAQAKFDYSTKPAEQPNRTNLQYVITPGPREYVRDVLINGLERTREDLVMNRISLHPGDPLSQSRITGSQRRLYDLGIFARVNAGIQNPDGDEPTKYVLYSMEEAMRYSMNFGFGAEIGRIGGGTTSLDSPAGTTGFSPRGSFGISRLNFLGLGHTISLQTLVSTLRQRALVSYLAPQFEGKPTLSLQISTLFDLSHDVRTFSARREEGSIQLAQKLSKANTLQYRYTFRKVNIIGTPLVNPELIPLLSQPVRVGFFSMTVIQDRRDDPLDAHRGIYNTVDLQFAAKEFGSQTGFGRLLAQNATYHPLTKNLVLARSTTFGVIERYAGLPEIPLAERFFGGGASSNRAFPDFQAGPRDPVTGFPIGGNALLNNTIELRFPLIGDNLGGVLFNDMGNVYSSVSNMSLRFRQRKLVLLPDPTQGAREDFDYAVQSFGLGFRYRTPIGPVRVDFSLSPNSPRFLGFKGTENQLLFGGGQQVVQRINVFQFHFSLGQAF